MSSETRGKSCAPVAVSLCCYSAAFASSSRSYISLLLDVICVVAAMIMDRSEQIKLCVGYYWIMRMQFDT
ncbi:hypothetical protein HN873_036517, partial [Arachis hypogaea]